MTANEKQNLQNPIVRLQLWIDETLPALEHIMMRLGMFTVLTVGLVTIVVLLLRH